MTCPTSKMLAHIRRQAEAAAMAETVDPDALRDELAEAAWAFRWLAEGQTYRRALCRILVLEREVTRLRTKAAAEVEAEACQVAMLLPWPGKNNDADREDEPREGVHLRAVGE